MRMKSITAFALAALVTLGTVSASFARTRKQENTKANTATTDRQNSGTTRRHRKHHGRRHHKHNRKQAHVRKNKALNSKSIKKESY